MPKLFEYGKSYEQQKNGEIKVYRSIAPNVMECYGYVK